MLTGSWQLAEEKAHDASYFVRMPRFSGAFTTSCSCGISGACSGAGTGDAREFWAVPGWSGSWPPGHPPRARRGPSAALEACGSSRGLYRAFPFDKLSKDDVQHKVDQWGLGGNPKPNVSFRACRLNPGAWSWDREAMPGRLEVTFRSEAGASHALGCIQQRAHSHHHHESIAPATTPRRTYKGRYMRPRNNPKHIPRPCMIYAAQFSKDCNPPVASEQDVRTWGEAARLV